MPRKSKFSVSEILQMATVVFWEKGYQGTSMRDLVNATGLHPGSIYHSFGNKKQLFIEVTDHYYADLTSRINASLSAGEAADSILRGFFIKVLSNESAPTVRGCLLVNTLMECSDDSDIQAHIAAMFSGFEEMFYWTLVQGQKQAVFKPNFDCRKMAKALVNDYFGLRVQSLTELPQDEIQSLIDFRLAQLS